MFKSLKMQDITLQQDLTKVIITAVFPQKTIDNLKYESKLFTQLPFLKHKMFWKYLLLHKMHSYVLSRASIFENLREDVVFLKDINLSVNLLIVISPSPSYQSMPLYIYYTYVLVQYIILSSEKKYFMRFCLRVQIIFNFKH